MKLTQEQFDKIVADAQDLQKRNPWGSPPHREAYEAIRAAVLNFKGHDIGRYE